MPTPLKPLESAADETILTWPDVRARQVFGHRGYVRGGKMFAFLAHGGIGVKAENPASAERLYASGAAVPFEYGEGMQMRGWPVFPLATDADLLVAVQSAWEAYERLVRRRTLDRSSHGNEGTARST